MKLKNRAGFTLLEIIIVIIIVGVLASLALPRLFSTIEYSRSTEALGAITVIRGALERCYLARSGDYNQCTFTNGLDIPNPGSAPNNHFTYTISNASRNSYTITALRNTRDGGDATAGIVLSQTATTVTRTGNGAFANIQ